MKLNNEVEIVAFRNAIRQCKGSVWLESPEGDKFNLKSTFSQYLAIGNMLNERGNQLELFCGDHADEKIFYDLFNKHPDML